MHDSFRPTRVCERSLRLKDEDMGFRMDWHGVQEGKYQNFGLDTGITNGRPWGKWTFNGLTGLEALEMERSLNSLIPFHFYG